MKTIDISKLSACKKFAKEFSKKLKSGDIIFLQGDLGSGKTTFVKCILESLNFKLEAKSPTFNLVNLYKEKKLSICHMDLYRLKEGDDIESFVEYFDGENITFIEWPEILLNKNIKCDYILSFDYKNNKRTIAIK